MVGPISLVPIKIIRHRSREKSDAISACSLESPGITYSNFSIVTAPEPNRRFIEVSKSLWFPGNAMAADSVTAIIYIHAFGVREKRLQSREKKTEMAF